MSDFECDLNCPPSRLETSSLRCCSNCAKSKIQFLEKHPELKELWDNKIGFATEKGCKLARNKRPVECNEYDCRESDYFHWIRWNKQTAKWDLVTGIEVPKNVIRDKNKDNFLTFKISEMIGIRNEFNGQ